MASSHLYCSGSCCPILTLAFGRRMNFICSARVTYYAVTRALQMKFMRLPKAKVKIGQQLPEQYR